MGLLDDFLNQKATEILMLDHTAAYIEAHGPRHYRRDVDTFYLPETI